MALAAVVAVEVHSLNQTSILLASCSCSHAQLPPETCSRPKRHRSICSTKGKTDLHSESVLSLLRATCRASRGEPTCEVTIIGYCIAIDQGIRRITTSVLYTHVCKKLFTTHACNSTKTVTLSTSANLVHPSTDQAAMKTPGPQVS